MEVSAQPTFKRSKRLTSVVWNDFERVKKDEIMVAICKHCQKKLSGSSTSGTSHLRNHLKRCLRRASQDIAPQLVVVREKKKDRSDLVKFKFDRELSSVDLKFNQEQSGSDLARMIMMHGYPLAMVEHAGFKKFVTNLQPSFQIMSCDSAQAECMQIYQREKQKVYEMLDKVSGRISLTVNMWNSYQDKRYMCLAALYIDESWQLQKKILNFVMVDPATEALSEAIMTCMINWDIDRKMFSITLDNCATSDNSVFRVKDRLSHNRLILHNGQLFHVRCAAHIIYQCVQDVFEALHEITHKIRESIRYVKASEAIKQKFSEMALQSNSQKSLSLDCLTKWDSTYHMLEAAVEQKEVFLHLQESNSGLMMAPSPVEWERASAVTNCLKLFYEVLNVFSGVKYPTANLYFPEICDFHLEAIKWCNSSDVFIEAMAFKIKNKFDTYWRVSSLSLAITAVLDPRFKMKLVEYYYTQIYGSSASEHIEEVFQGIGELYNEYAIRSTFGTVDQGLTSGVQNGCGINGISPTVSNDTRDRLSGFDKFLHESSYSPHKNSDLEMYLEEPVFPRNKDFDILNWWKVNSPKYPILSLMARDMLGIPMSIKAASGSEFDTGGKVLDSHQSSLSPDVLEALISTHDWLQGEI